MSVSSCLMSRQRKHVAFLIKYIQIRLGVFISANPYYKLFHLSIWQNNQENIVLSVPAAPSTSQSISHCLQCFTILYYFTTFICQLHHGAHRACFPQVQQNALLSKFLSWCQGLRSSPPYKDIKVIWICDGHKKSTFSSIQTLLKLVKPGSIEALFMSSTQINRSCGHSVSLKIKEAKVIILSEICLQIYARKSWILAF